MTLLYKIAETSLEFEQIHELNYQTFAEEIPQHSRNDSQILVDKFHDENTYIICKKGHRVIGMIAVRSKRPFSLDGKVGRVEKRLPLSVENPVEIRLLAIERAYRNGRAFLGLMQALVLYCLKAGFDAALISGTVREQKLYGQLGFQAFAELTGTAEAAFQPMYLTKETFEKGVAGRILKPHINFLPGPVTLSREVRTALTKEPISHRSIEFKLLLERVKIGLTSLTKAQYVQVLQGTGTLANDVVAGQLSLIGGKGLILVNGEFGTRLIDHAARFGMTFECIEEKWGVPFNMADITRLIKSGQYSWLWMVHSETSTGILNDYRQLNEICHETGVVLALDCISSLGTVPLNLEKVAFASGVSGKGLASYTGLSFVFHSKKVASDGQLPRYLDLGAYMEADGVPYTQSSNLLEALEDALKNYNYSENVFRAIEERAEKVRRALVNLGLTIHVAKQNATPAILTVVIKEGACAAQIGDNLFMNGFNVHYESTYLRERNWLQIACFNNVAEKDLDRLLHVFSELIATEKQAFTQVGSGEKLD